MAKMTDDELRAIIGARLSDTLGSTDAELRQDRESALDHYYGRPYGNEIEGRAQVVTKDLMDVIEWTMPSLLRVFSTKDAVQFDPVGPEDETLAKQESLYVSHVLWKKNPGFMLMYNWLKDGLMQKVGYVKYWWDDEENVEFDKYSGLSDEQVALTIQTLQQDGEVEVVGAEQEENGWEIKLKITKKCGRAKIDVIPPDEVIVHKDCRGSVKSARMVGHMRRNVMRSDLIEMGYSRKQVESLTSYELPKTVESLARDTVGESINQADNAADLATQELTLLEAYTYVDVDDDGIAELRRLLLAGNEILENEEAPEIPFCSWTPIPVPHRHVGLSIDDTMEDLQRINSALTRGLLDNTYFTMNERKAYDKNTVDVASLQVNRPGGHVAVDGPPGMSLMSLPVNPMAGQLLPVIDYTAQVLEKRTGVGRMTSGVDADVLAQSTKGAYVDAKSAANQRIEAIARIFAETGLSDLYGSLHKLLSHNQDWSTREQLKGEWVTVNPAEWKERANLTVSVGLGNSSREEVRANLSAIAQFQMQAASVPGLVQPQNVYALFNRLATELGFEQSGFITDPKSQEYQKFMQSQQPQPDPYVQGKQIDAQTKAQEKQVDAVFKVSELAQERDLAITDMELKYGTDLAKAGIGAEVARGAQVARAGGGANPQQSEAPRGVPGSGYRPNQPNEARPAF